MEWKHYWRNVVRRYQVIIEGWPSSVAFRNLSETSTSLSELELLLDGWRNGRVYWTELSNSELEDHEATRKENIRNGEAQASPKRQRRSDHGKKRKRRAARGAIGEEAVDDAAPLVPNYCSD